MDSLTRYKKIFGDILRVGRDMEKLTVDEISERIGVSPGTYRNIESGQRLPTTTQIEGLAELFKSSFKEIIDLSLKMFKEEADKEDFDGKDGKEYRKEYSEYVIPIYKLASEMESKWKKEKEEMADKGAKLAEDLIRTGQRYHTPNKYLTDDDIYNLSEQIMALVDLRVKQVLRKHNKA